MTMHSLKKREQEDLFSDVEKLECRQMLAGNISAVINGGGNLIINGDGDNNDISVEIDNFGEVSIEGNDGETIDDSGLIGAVVTGDVKINMKGGNDDVYLTRVFDEATSRGFETLIDDITIIGGSGDDYVTAAYLYGVTGDLKISGGGGNDGAAIKYSNMLGDVNITGGGGNDDAMLTGIVCEDMKINQGGGADTVDLSSSHVGAKLSISVGSGDNEVSLSEYATAEAGIQIRGGGGIDYITVQNLSMTGSAALSIRTSGGDDTVMIENANVTGELDVNTGGGNDTVGVKYEVDSLKTRRGLPDGSNFGSVKFTLGGGDDSLSIFGNVNGSGTANGGGGSDYLGNFSDGLFALDDSNFEEFPEIIG